MPPSKGPMCCSVAGGWGRLVPSSLLGNAEPHTPSTGRRGSDNVLSIRKEFVKEKTLPSLWTSQFIIYLCWWCVNGPSQNNLVCCLVTDLCPTLCDPMDCSPPGFSVHGILVHSRILKWVAISFSKGSSWLRDWTCISCISRQILYPWATWEAPRWWYLHTFDCHVSVEFLSCLCFW